MLDGETSFVVLSVDVVLVCCCCVQHSTFEYRLLRLVIEAVLRPNTTVVVRNVSLILCLVASEKRTKNEGTNILIFEIKILIKILGVNSYRCCTELISISVLL